MENLQNILAEVDRDRMMDRIRYMTETFPYRLAGSETEYQASLYVTDVMESYGMDPVNLTFRTYNSDPLTSSVEIIAPEQFCIDSLPCGHIRSTGDTPEEFEIVYVGSGAWQDYEDLDVEGKMVLVEVSYAPPVPEKAHIACVKGAAGIMCMNWGNDEEVICHRALKSVWGNPTPESFGDIPDIIGVGITRLAGLKIKELCLSGQTVRARVLAKATRQWTEVHQPYGIIRGNGKSDEFMLIASHLDAWQPGVTCNATGNATTLELCRILSAHRDELDRDIHVVFWNGHEIAEAAGSTWFVDHYWDLINKKCIGYMHIDSTGVSETEKLEIKISDELYKFARENVRHLPEDQLRIMTLRKIGDQSFMGIGVPAVCQRISFTEEAMAKAHGATLGWWNHTIEDGVDKCDPDILYEDTKIHLEFVWKLVNSGILPYDFEKKFETISNNLYPLAEKYQAQMDFTDLLHDYEEAKQLVLDIQKRRDTADASKQELFNEFLKTTSRLLTNVFQTYASKYDQDRYGHSNLSEPVPLLANLKKLGQLEPTSLEYGLYETELQRNMNRIIDSLDMLARICRLYAVAL